MHIICMHAIYDTYIFIRIIIIIQEKNLKLEVKVKNQDDVLKQLKHRDNTVRTYYLS